MSGSHESIRLLEPTEAFREEFLSLLQEYQEAGENISNAELARTDFAAYLTRRAADLAVCAAI